MDNRRKKQTLRWRSIRCTLGLSIQELAQHLHKSEHTIIAIEGGTRNASLNLYQAFISLAKTHGIFIDMSWLTGQDVERPPTTEHNRLQQRLQIEHTLERYALSDEFQMNAKAFSTRLKLLIQRMNISDFHFARWCGIGLPTVHRWLKGSALPSFNKLRNIAYNAIEEAIPLSLDWLCEGIGTLPDFKLNRSIDHGTTVNSESITITIDTIAYSPLIQPNTIITSHPTPAQQFKITWPGFYLLNYNNTWIPVQLQATEIPGNFNIQSLHQDPTVQIVQTHVSLEMLYPIVQTTLPYSG